MKKHIGRIDNYINFNEINFGSEEIRIDLKNTRFEYIKFNNSSFRNCNFINVTFKNCDFNSCDFKEIRQWNCNYEKSNFYNANFQNASMGVKTKYNECQFLRSKLFGRTFSFGRNSEFIKCNFEKSEIKSVWILSTKFIECDFSSKFTNVRFSGELEARVSTVNGNIEFPANLTNCNMTNSKFEELEIMDGTILVGTKLPEQYSERINNDRIYYPKK